MTPKTAAKKTATPKKPTPRKVAPKRQHRARRPNRPPAICRGPFIGDFNQLDAKHGLDTIDREEVGEAFAALTEAAGLGAETDALFDAWRDF